MIQRLQRSRLLALRKITKTAQYANLITKLAVYDKPAYMTMEVLKLGLTMPSCQIRYTGDEVNLFH